jgi:hypothetical protein
MASKSCHANGMTPKPSKTGKYPTVIILISNWRVHCLPADLKTQELSKA